MKRDALGSLGSSGTGKSQPHRTPEDKEQCLQLLRGHGSRLECHSQENCQPPIYNESNFKLCKATGGGALTVRVEKPRGKHRVQKRGILRPEIVGRHRKMLKESSKVPGMHQVQRKISVG
jgi:hypothetical protein